MKKNLLRISVWLLLLIVSNKAQELTKYVDPFIGTGGHGHTYPGATVPFGMVQLSPDTRVGNWDACGGYHYSDNTIIGFSHQHLSGVGVLDYGDILFMPTVGKIQFNSGDENNTLTGYRSKFEHSNEIASPGYYSVMLEDYKIKAELTATTRAGFHRYTYPKEKTANLIIDLKHQLDPGEKIIKLEFKIINEYEVQGLRRSSGWASDQIVYFYAKFSKPIIEFGISKNDVIIKDIKSATGDNLKAYLKFDNNDGKALLIKVGISAVDYEGVKKNLLKEIPGWDFDQVKKDANDAWNKQLNKIVIKDNSEEKKKIFYTALYHSSIIPNTYYDVDRRYRGNDRKIHTCTDFDNYTIFSLWDTFRATHPLFVLIEPERTKNLIKSMLVKYEESGLLPKWELAGNETETMIGYHSVSAITDAYIKGITDFDAELALEAMIKSATDKTKNIKYYTEMGFIPSNKGIASVSKTLEYAYDDWCIYTFAKALGKNEIAEEYKLRAKHYINLFDGSTGFFRGKKSNGNWDSSFDPIEISRNYTEANAWQYSMFVPHDVNGLINLQGNKENIIKHLDKMFTEVSELSGHDIPDVTGLIGQYAHGNEPSHHVAYLYNFADQPWKTQQRINQINNEMYTTKPDGLIGNEDCGQMSSWYVFSSMGFYPFCPGTEEYQIGTPFFEDVTINLENGKKINIKAKNLNKHNYYVQSVFVNGNEISSSYIKHNDFVNGGIIEFVMGDKPNKNWGIGSNLSAYSLSNTLTTSIPFITNDVGYFVGKTEINFGCSTKDAVIRFTIDGSEPTEKSKIFDKKFEIENSILIKARAFKKGFQPGEILTVNAIKAEFLKPTIIEGLTQGVKYTYYEELVSSVYEIKNGVIKKEGELNYFNLDEAEKEDHYGFIYEGYINILEDNIYNFHCKSDDGSVLIINDMEIVNNDGSHGTMSTSGSIALQKGMHPYTLLYFEDYEGNSIEVSWESNTIKKELLPAELLYK